MKRKHVLEILDKLDGRYIAEAENPPKKAKKRPYWIGVVAAALAAVICIGSFFGSAPAAAKAVALPAEARITEHPIRGDYKDIESYTADYDAWKAESEPRKALKENAVGSLSPFFTEASAEFLVSENGENVLWSPINAYIGLSMLAEITDGDSRREILDLFGAEDIEALRSQVSAVWESVYEDDGNEICTPANSLWLKDGLDYRQDTMDNLAYHYYASVYQTDLGSDSADKAIGEWLDKNTGGMLKDRTGKTDLSPDTVLALYSTLFFQAKWRDEFDSKNNTEDVFHGVGGDTEVTYMNKKLCQMDYYWHENYSAVALSLKNGSTMWFILPDEGKTAADVLKDGAYGEMISSSDGEDGWQNKKYMKVNLSVPKFDVSSTVNLKDGLGRMGVNKVFDTESSDFTAITSDTPVWITAVNQSARVEIDEKGVKAAAYIEIPGAGAAMPPEEIIDFLLDRPFLFVISKGNLPLFTGVVNNISE
ncbi:MAG: serpin family protein [Ruminococcaceae bacterium]|nr:serpin family protein [Oscillospiraceae bacterium]